MRIGFRAERHSFSSEGNLMKILVTGFEPFGRWQRQPEWGNGTPPNGTIVGARRSAVCGCQFPSAALLPTDRCDCEVHPDVVLNLGLGAPGGIRVERVAVNRCTAPPGGDNDGYDPDGEPVLSDGPATYRSTLPVAASSTGSLPGIQRGTLRLGRGISVQLQYVYGPASYQHP